MERIFSECDGTLPFHEAYSLCWLPPFLICEWSNIPEWRLLVWLQYLHYVYLCLNCICIYHRTLNSPHTRGASNTNFQDMERNFMSIYGAPLFVVWCSCVHSVCMLPQLAKLKRLQQTQWLWTVVMPWNSCQASCNISQIIFMKFCPHSSPFIFFMM